MKIKKSFLGKIVLLILPLVLSLSLGMVSCEQEEAPISILNAISDNGNAGQAQGEQGERVLFGFDNSSGNIVKIDTSTGLATVVGPTDLVGPAGMATSRGAVSDPGGAVFPEGTHFGVLRDSSGNDFVVAVDVTTGEADGFTDITLKFDTQKVIDAIKSFLGREPVDHEMITIPLTGKLKDEFGGTDIVGEDVIVILE